MASVRSVNHRWSNRQHCMLTRRLAQIQRSTFAFLDLPAELRNTVYEFSAAEFKGVERYFSGYHKRLVDAKSPGLCHPPRVFIKTPTIFLINRQIFTEAIAFVYRNSSLNLEHGLFKVAYLRQIICPNVIENLTSLTISDVGHPTLNKSEDPIMPQSWFGYLRIFKTVSETFAGRQHKLKELNIKLTDPLVHVHIHTCWDAPLECGIRNGLKDTVELLHKIRGVGSVTIEGAFPAEVCARLKARMESKPVNFLDLPAELRNSVYEYAADYNDSSKVLAKMLDNWPNKRTVPPYPALTTPSVLLVNKQISNEALSVLRKKPLVFTLPTDKYIAQTEQFPQILRFISPVTLKSIKEITFRLDIWEWMYSFKHVIPILIKHTGIKNFHLHFTDRIKAQMLSVGTEYPDIMMRTAIGDMAKIRAKTATFSGDLPACYTDPMKAIIESGVDTADESLPNLQAHYSNGMLIDVSD